MRNRFDELAKMLGTAALTSCGKTYVQDAISTESQYADLRHEPDPTRHHERAQLGLLGRLTREACILETFSRALPADELRGCLAKHLAFWQRRTRARQSPPDLWIISAGVPETVLAKLPFTPADGWPTGVYLLGADVLRVGLVIASQLPRDPTTLLVRLMAGSRVLTAAIPEVTQLPPTSSTRLIAESVLLQFERLLQDKPNLAPDEKEFIMQVHKSWEDFRQEGRQEGRQEALQEALRKLLVAKFGEVSSELDAKIATATSAELERYFEQALFADSLAAVFA